MADQSCREHLSRLKEAGLLATVARPVHPDSSLSAIGWKAFAERGKATLFENIEGHAGWRAFSQILSSRRMWSLALGLEERSLPLAMGTRMAKPVDPVIVDAGSAPVKAVRMTGGAVDLTSLPAVKISDRDGGRYLASGVTVVKDPETGICNLSIHRQQIFDAKRSGFLLLPRQARQIYRKYCAMNKPMPVAVSFGVHPAIFFGATYSAPFGVDETALAGALLGEPVRLVKCETIDLQVPAEAEFVIEGLIHPGSAVPEGPFGEVAGTYAGKGSAEVLEVTAITRRADAIHYAIHCGMPVTDTQAVSALAVEVRTWEHLKGVDGGLLDILDVRCLPESGAYAVVLKLRPRAPGQAKLALMAALSGPSTIVKLAIAVDDDIDVSTMREVMWAIATRVDAANDVHAVPGVRVFALDAVSRLVPSQAGAFRVGAKWFIDATVPMDQPGVERAKFDAALPPNLAGIDLDQFL